MFEIFEISWKGKDEELEISNIKDVSSLMGK
jgi:hypothetical protein